MKHKNKPESKPALATVRGQRAFIKAHLPVLSSWAKQSHEQRGRGYFCLYVTDIAADITFQTPKDWHWDDLGCEWLDSGFADYVEPGFSKSYDPATEFLFVFWQDRPCEEPFFDIHRFKLCPQKSGA